MVVVVVGFELGTWCVRGLEDVCTCVWIYRVWLLRLGQMGFAVLKNSDAGKTRPFQKALAAVQILVTDGSPSPRLQTPSELYWRREL